MSNLREKVSPSVSRQTTSTPFDYPAIVVSPGSTESSFIGASRILGVCHENHIESFTSRLKVPDLSAASNRFQNTSGSSQQNNRTGEHEKKVRVEVQINNSVIDEQIRVREDMLSHLKSIDVTKYSFPNESSYLVENKHLVDDTLGMPNLCRRSRISSQTSLVSNLSSLIKSSTSSLLSPQPPAQTAPEVKIESNIKPVDTKESSKNTGIYQSIKGIVGNSAQKESKAKTMEHKFQSLKRNLGNDLEDDCQSPEMSSPLRRRSVPRKDNKIIATTPSLNRRSPLHARNEWSLAHLCSSKLFWLAFLFLMPAFFVATNWYEAGGRLDMDHLEKCFHLQPNEETRVYLRRTYEQTFEFFENVWDQYFTRAALFDRIRNKTGELQEKTSNYIKDLVTDLKPDQFDFGKTIHGINQSAILENLTALKEKVESYFKTQGPTDATNSAADFQLFRKLDEKINHLVQEKITELNKEHTSELSELKNILKELGSIVGELKKLPNPSHESALGSGRRNTFLEDHEFFKALEKYVQKMIHIYDADKTGKADFASESLGASILFTQETQTYNDNTRWLTVFNQPITRITSSPRVVIQNSVQPGNCWAFKGHKADLFIKLAAQIRPTCVSIEHIPKQLSLMGTITSAPQNFTVYGYKSVKEISDENRYLLGSFRFDNESEKNIQFFDVQHTYPDVPISAVQLKIESNWGNENYTCLYKFRVHGKLFQREYQDDGVNGELRPSFSYQAN